VNTLFSLEGEQRVFTPRGQSSPLRARLKTGLSASLEPEAVLPDGSFSNPKNLHVGKFWSVLQRCSHICTYYGHMVNFPAIWYILWPFYVFSPVWVYFDPFWYVIQGKSGNPDRKHVPDRML
jgi:hypothetical protein